MDKVNGFYTKFFLNLFFCLFITFFIQAQDDVPIPTRYEADSVRIEEYRRCMDRLRLAKQNNDDSTILASYAWLSRFYSLGENTEKAKHYKNFQLQLINQKFPDDSALYNRARLEYITISVKNNELVDNKEIFQILDFALQTNDAELEENTRAMYISYLMQRDLLEEYSRFYTEEYPQALRDLKSKDHHSYLRTRATISEVNGDRDSSIFYMKKAELTLNDEPKKNIYYVSNFYYRFGQIYERQSNISRAIEQYEKSLEIATEVGYMPFMLQASNRLLDLHTKKNDYEDALKYALLNLELQKEINSLSNKDELLKLEIKKENELTQLELEKLEIANAAKLEKEMNRKKIFYLAGFALLLIVIGLWSRNQFIRKANFRLEEARNRAVKSERFKQQFLANMSHEIRTPMNAVLGMTNLTLDTELTEKQEKYLTAVKRSSENLLVIINDILDLSKMEAGKMELESIPFKLMDQIQLVYDTLRYKAEDKGLEFIIDVGTDVPEYLIGDPSRLNQVLINLCGNSIKFTERGFVKIVVKKVNEKANYFRFSVLDTGIGIPEDKVNNLFSAFEQVDSSTFRKYGGTGLGLTISKTLVELQKGEIGIYSEEGKGSEFFFDIPFLEAGKEDIARIESDEKIDATKLRGIRILLVEDNEFNQIVVNDTIENLIQGAKVSIAENGRKAIEMLEKNDFDVILMDVNMPIMNGHEASQFIRNNFQSPKSEVPILALTASVLMEDIQHCLDVGMNDYVPKPFKREELISTLSKYYSVG